MESLLFRAFIRRALLEDARLNESPLSEVSFSKPKTTSKPANAYPSSVLKEIGVNHEYADRHAQAPSSSGIFRRMASGTTKSKLNGNK